MSPLVHGVCRRFGLREADVLDVGQSVWLALLEHLDRIRAGDALPGWIATTARRECLQLVTGKTGRQRRELVGDVDGAADDPADDIADLLLSEERHAALREAFRSLAPQHQQLLLLLLRQPPLAYTEISRTLGMPVGSIGPTRGRCIEKLRAHPAVQAIMEPDAAASREAGRPS
jgi:RNA polymerase sigma factor (sigma-70 family)